MPERRRRGTCDLALLPDQRLGEIVEHAFVDLVRRNREVLHANRTCGRLEIQPALLVVALKMTSVRTEAGTMNLAPTTNPSRSFSSSMNLTLLSQRPRDALHRWRHVLLGRVGIRRTFDEEMDRIEVFLSLIFFFR